MLLKKYEGEKMNLLIKNYISKLTVKDVIGLCKKKGIKVSEIDAEILLNTAKEHWMDFYEKDPSSTLLYLKDKLDTNTYNKLLKVYLEYKNKGIIH